ncbi:MAG: TIGR02301 family protein, partial [Planctomycetota bacterium]
MKKLVDLEEPTAAQRNAMVEAFNKGYRDARRAYASCERAAEDRAAASAAEGERIVEALASALRPADDALAAGPTVTRGRN